MGLTVYGGGGKPEEEKTVIAGTSVMEVLPSSGKTMKKVNVNPTPTEEKTITAGTSATTVMPTSGKYIKKVTVNPTPSQEKTATPTTAGFEVTPDEGYLLNKVVVSGDSDLVAENIREGIDIWGVVGTLVEGVAGIDFGEITLASKATFVTVSHNLGVVPSWVALIPKSLATTSSSSLFNINGKTAYSALSSNPLIQVESAANTLSAEEITFATHSNPFAATGYYWFAIA